MPELELLDKLPTWCPITTEAGPPSRMPNPDRALANGEPLYSAFIDIFADDVSGNKHWNIYCTHRNLPRSMLQQEFHTHFVSTSPNASVAEQFQGIKSVIECVQYLITIFQLLS
jgi:hypothetical protein